MPDTAYVAAVKMLGRRELSEAQIRQRLARRAFTDDEIDNAIVRLKADRALDDSRVAAALARVESGLRKRGPLRIRQRLAVAGIPAALADRAIEEVTSQVDMDAMLAAALERRLRGEPIADEKQMARLFRQLTTQGFEPDRVMKLLRAHRRADAGQA